MWRGFCRSNISVSAPFVWRCLSGSTVTPFPHPAHRTGQADFPHPAAAPAFAFWAPLHYAGAAADHEFAVAVALEPLLDVAIIDVAIEAVQPVILSHRGYPLLSAHACKGGPSRRRALPTRSRACGNLHQAHNVDDDRPNSAAEFARVGGAWEGASEFCLPFQ